MFKRNQPFVAFDDGHGEAVYNRFFGRDVAKTAKAIVVIPTHLYGNGNGIAAYFKRKVLPILDICDECRRCEWSKVPKTIRCQCGRLSDYTLCAICQWKH